MKANAFLVDLIRIMGKSQGGGDNAFGFACAAGGGPIGAADGGNGGRGRFLFVRRVRRLAGTGAVEAGDVVHGWRRYGSYLRRSDAVYRSVRCDGAWTPAQGWCLDAGHILPSFDFGGHSAAVLRGFLGPDETRASLDGGCVPHG